jgi:hypothetical protein
MVDWTKDFPPWTAPVVESMKRLDAFDAPKKGPKYDGRYMGADLIGLARLYAKKYSSHDPGFQRIFDAMAGIRSYFHQLPDNDSKAKERNNIHAIIVHALFEGARAVLEKREPKYANVPWFSSEFIDVEFALYFNQEIYGTKGTVPNDGWVEFWKDVLDDCRTDLFLRPTPCAL